MAIPDYQTIMLPFLKLLANKEEHSKHEVVEVLADHFNLTDQERQEMLPSGQQELFDNRVGWSRTYLKKAGLIESTKRGFFRISSRGSAVLQENPETVDKKDLERFAEFKEFLSLHHKEKFGKTDAEEEETETPEESLANAYQSLRNQLADDLLQQVKSVTPHQFEKIVIDVLVAMNYGGNRPDAAKALGGSHDGGIDGIIKEDQLGLEVIYVQAKQWQGTVGRPEIQKFAGALLGQRAKKGIFITASDFSKEAWDYPNHIDSKIILIDGQSLVQSMIDHNVGVNCSATYEIKKIDTDYFVGD
jgi:restriction system protein